MKKQYGHYLENGVDFCITERNIPRNWYNYLWNDKYISYTSQTSAGESFLQDELGRRVKLVSDRGFFILEGDKSFGIGGLPVNEEVDSYKCIHYRGASEIHTEKDGLSAVVSIIVRKFVEKARKNKTRASVVKTVAPKKVKAKKENTDKE